MICTMSMFLDWLNEELRTRGMSQADLARRAGVTRTAISDLLNERRNPGKSLATGISRAFDLPPEFVFRKAGLLPPRRDADEETNKARALFESLTSEGQSKALEYLGFLREMEKRGSSGSSGRSKRGGG